MITDEEIDAEFAKAGSDTIYGFARAIYQLGRQHQREIDAALCDMTPIRFGNDGLWRPEIKASILKNTGDK